MGAAAVREVNNKLPDGRSMRALEGTYIQKQMFSLRSSGLYVPANEGILIVKDLDQAIQSGAYQSVNANGWSRTSEYAFYPKGFEKRDIPLGEKLVYVEDGVAHTLNVPDVPVKLPNGKTVGLRQAIGMGVIRLEKLQYKEIDEKSDLVEVTTDFNPATDVKIVDVMRPRAWALVDADGYPLKSQPSNDGVSEARNSYVRHYDQINAESTGYHGSVALGVDYVDIRRVVIAGIYWSNVSGVALVGREAAAPQKSTGTTPFRTAPDLIIPAALASELRSLHVTSQEEVAELANALKLLKSGASLEATNRVLAILEEVLKT